jgi:glutathione-specific gamma-glutamylcyclotransferase
MNVAFEHLDDDLWVFGYGSLIWRPGFTFIERIPARLFGLHRALCVYSFVHRGTPECPGLVLGLDRGGACRGLAYRVGADKRAETIAYLRAREQVTKVYREAMRPVILPAQSSAQPERRVRALVYIRSTLAGSILTNSSVISDRATVSRDRTGTTFCRR